MSVRSWDDQPPILEGMPRIFHAVINGTLMEVRKADENTWYISAGGLFSSQTVKCPSAEVALQLLQHVVHHNMTDAPAALPEGCQLVRLHATGAS